MAKVTDRFLYSDLDFNFAKTATNDVARKFDSNAIRQSLRNIVLTNFYERPFRPSLGVNLLSKLFDNFHKDNEVCLKVREKVKNKNKLLNLIPEMITPGRADNSLLNTNEDTIISIIEESWNIIR